MLQYDYNLVRKLPKMPATLSTKDGETVLLALRMFGFVESYVPISRFISQVNDTDCYTRYLLCMHGGYVAQVLVVTQDHVPGYSKPGERAARIRVNLTHLARELEWDLSELITKIARHLKPVLVDRVEDGRLVRA